MWFFKRTSRDNNDFSLLNDMRLFKRTRYYENSPTISGVLTMFPNEVKFNIFKFLGRKDIENLKQTCHACNNLFITTKIYTTLVFDKDCIKKCTPKDIFEYFHQELTSKKFSSLFASNYRYKDTFLSFAAAKNYLDSICQKYSNLFFMERSLCILEISNIPVEKIHCLPNNQGYKIDQHELIVKDFSQLFICHESKVKSIIPRKMKSLQNPDSRIEQTYLPRFR